MMWNNNTSSALQFTTISLRMNMSQGHHFTDEETETAEVRGPT